MVARIISWWLRHRRATRELAWIKVRRRIYEARGDDGRPDPDALEACETEGDDIRKGYR